MAWKFTQLADSIIQLRLINIKKVKNTQSRLLRLIGVVFSKGTALSASDESDTNTPV